MTHAYQLDGNGNPVAIPDGDSTDSGDVNIAELERTMVHPPKQAASAPATTRLPVATGKPATAREMAREIRARLRLVNIGIKERKTLEQERDQLKRLLAALKTKQAPVRSLRSTG